MTCRRRRHLHLYLCLEFLSHICLDCPHWLLSVSADPISESRRAPVAAALPIRITRICPDNKFGPGHYCSVVIGGDAVLAPPSHTRRKCAATQYNNPWPLSPRRRRRRVGPPAPSQVSPVSVGPDDSGAAGASMRWRPALVSCNYFRCKGYWRATSLSRVIVPTNSRKKTRSSFNWFLLWGNLGLVDTFVF